MVHGSIYLPFEMNAALANIGPGAIRGSQCSGSGSVLLKCLLNTEFLDGAIGLQIGAIGQRRLFE